MKQYSYIRLERLISIIFYLMLLVLFTIIVLYIKDMNYYTWIKYFSIIVISQFSFQYLILKKLGFKIMSLTGFFLIFSYLFHFGQILIIGLFPEYEFQRFNYVRNLSPYYIKESAMFSLFVILAFGFGILISNKKVTNNIQDYKECDLVKCKSVGGILIAITFPIQLYLDINKIIISVNHGYLATYETELAGVWGAIGFFSFTGIGLLILGYSKQKKKSLIIYFLVFVYLIITMITGHRGHQLTILLFLTYIIHKTVYRINFKRLFIIGLISLFCITFLNTIALFRGIENKTFPMFAEIFINKLQNNPLFELITEMGGTIYTPYLVMQQLPYNRPYAYGTTYAAGLFSVLPNIGGIFSDINKYASFAKNIIGSALGGSYIAELYYNFSYFGIFFAIFIGIFINSISQKVEYLISRQSYFKIGYYAPLFIYILWWPRDTFQAILRPTIWGAIALFIIDMFLRRFTYISYKNRYIRLLNN